MRLGVSRSRAAAGSGLDRVGGRMTPFSFPFLMLGIIMLYSVRLGAFRLRDKVLLECNVEGDNCRQRRSRRDAVFYLQLSDRDPLQNRRPDRCRTRAARSLLHFT
jgi:hypothetical protein